MREIDLGWTAVFLMASLAAAFVWLVWWLKQRGYNDGERSSTDLHESPPIDSARSGESWTLRHAGEIVVSGTVAAVVIILLSFAALPNNPGLVPVSTGSEFTTKDRVEAQNATRETGLKVATGIAALVVGLLAWGRIDLSRRQHLLAIYSFQNTQDLAVRGQVTDRWSRAIEQLGSDSEDIAAGGVFALEQIVADCPSYIANAISVLVSFIQRRSPAQLNEPNSTSSPPSSALMAALVIARMDRTKSTESRVTAPDLCKVDLRGLQLIGCDLSGFQLRYCDLTDLNIRDCTIYDLDLRGSADRR